MKLYEAFAQNHRLVCTEQWGEAAAERLARMEEILPSGSGFDKGTKLDACNDSRIVFKTSFHHMNETGFYDGWTDHRVTIRASLMHMQACDGHPDNRTRSEARQAGDSTPYFEGL